MNTDIECRNNKKKNPLHHVSSYLYMKKVIGGKSFYLAVSINGPIKVIE